MIFERAEESEAAAEALNRERMWPVSKQVNVSGRGDDDPNLIEPVEIEAKATDLPKTGWPHSSVMNKEVNDET